MGHAVGVLGPLWEVLDQSLNERRHSLNSLCVLKEQNRSIGGLVSLQVGAKSLVEDWGRGGLLGVLIDNVPELLVLLVKEDNSAS